MSDHVYKVIELVGSSAESSDRAAHNAVAEAAKSVRNMRWAEVVETRAHIEDQRIAHWQVKLKIGFTLEGTTSAG
ncbi:MAG: dodecin [Phycisphaerales bacterium JB040]